MRLATLISMPLCGLLLFSALPKNIWAEKTDTLGTGLERGYPWIAHSSVDGFYLLSPANESPGQPYQISLYQGFTIQSLTFASFHLGMRSRETLAPGFSQSYREPMSIKVSGTAEIFQDYLYFSLGSNFPVYSGKILLEDTSALYANLNEYQPLPTNAFLSPQAIQLGVFGRYLFSNWTTLGAFTYNRPARFDGIPDEPFFPASYFNFIGRAILETKFSRHRFDIKSTLYKDEETESRIPSHHEGQAWQIHYGFLRSYQKVAWQGGFGGILKMSDANRKLKLKSVLEPTVTNDNIQRVYGEFSISWIPNPDILWRLHIVPKGLFSFRDREFGSETELGAALGLKIFEVHRLRGGANFLYGNFAGKNNMGFGVKAEFSFRHLGFQDLEGEGESNSSEQ